ncbi:MAG TPA: lysozyme [Puia sp.]|jgi:lysozyme
MRISDKGLDLIKYMEGCILHPYLDQAGVPTIGWGSTIYSTGDHVSMQDRRLTQDQADKLLDWQVAVVALAVTKMTPGGLNQNQFDALVDFAYNVGLGALKGSTALKLIMANPNDPGIATALKLWNKIHVDGALVVCEDLVKRRQKEVELYFS